MPSTAIAPPVSQLPPLQRKHVVDLAALKGLVAMLPPASVYTIPKAVVEASELFEEQMNAHLLLNSNGNDDSDNANGAGAATSGGIKIPPAPIVDPILSYLTSSSAAASYASQCSDRVLEVISSAMHLPAAGRPSSFLGPNSTEQLDNALSLLTNVAATMYSQRYLTELSGGACGLGAAALPTAPAATGRGRAGAAAAAAAAHAGGVGGAKGSSTMMTYLGGIVPSSSSMDLLAPIEVAERLDSIIHDQYVPLARMIISTIAQLTASGCDAAVGPTSPTSPVSAASATPETLKSIRNASVLSLGPRATVILIDAVSPPAAQLPKGARSGAAGAGGPSSNANANVSNTMCSLEDEAAFNKYFKDLWIAYCKSTSPSLNSSTTAHPSSGKGSKGKAAAASGRVTPPAGPFTSSSPLRDVTPPVADLLSILQNVQLKFQMAANSPSAAVAPIAAGAGGAASPRADDPNAIPPNACECALRVAMADWLAASMATTNASGTTSPSQANTSATTRAVCDFLMTAAIPSTLIAELVDEMRARSASGAEGCSSTAMVSVSGSFINSSTLTLGEMAFVSASVKDSSHLLLRCATFLMLQHYLNPEDCVPTAVMSAVMSIAEGELNHQMMKRKADAAAMVLAHQQQGDDGGAATGSSPATAAKKRRTESSAAKDEALKEEIAKRGGGSANVSGGLLLSVLAASVPPAVHLGSFFPQLHAFNSIASRVTVRSYLYLSKNTNSASMHSATSQAAASGAKSLSTHAFVCKLLAGPCMALLLGSDDCERFLLAHGATSPSESARSRAAIAAAAAAEAVRSDSDAKWDKVKAEPNQNSDDEDDKKNVNTNASAPAGPFLKYSGPSSHLSKVEAYSRVCTKDFLLRLVNQFDACDGAAIFKDPVYPSTIMNHSGAQLGPYSMVVRTPMSLAMLRVCIMDGDGGFPSGGKTAADGSLNKPLSPTSATGGKARAPFPITTLAELRKGLWLIAANCSVFNAPEGPFPEKARIFVNHCCKLVDQAAGMMMI